MWLSAQKQEEFGSATVGMTPQAISLITNSGLFQDEVARRRKVLDVKKDEQLASVPADAKRILEESAVDAARVHQDIIRHCPDPRIKQASANSVLDRVYGTGQKQEETKNVVLISAKQLLILQTALSEVN